MSGAIFQSELSSLIQESKRKHLDVRAAAEKSLGELKALRITSEAQLAADLLRKPSFVEPFILACKSRNTKLVSSSVICLQRLAASHALPPEQLKDVLEALREVTSSGFDVQIKILQTLPSLLQTYASDLYGGLLFTCLDICGALQSSKTTVVSSTASATFQQLVSSAFERITDEDAAADSDTVRKVSIGAGTVRLKKAASDGFDIFSDLCSIADGVGTQRLNPNTIPLVFALDIIVTVLESNENVFQTHHELLFICRTRLAPALLRHIPAKHPFSATIRSLRVLYQLISRQFEHLQEESEKALDLLIHLLELEASQGWKRAACMELLRKLVLNFPLLRQIFLTFDLQEDRKDIVSKLMAALAKIAAEKPTIIGLSHQSTMPARQIDSEEDRPEQAPLEAAGVEGIIGSTVTAESHITGIGNAWSLPKTPCLEQLDKNDASDLPETYIYSMVLDCIYSFSEGLAKFVMPLSLTRSARKRGQAQIDEQFQDGNDRNVSSEESRSAAATPVQEPQKVLRPVSALKLTSNSQSESIRTAAALVTFCWPAFLATCATFLNAALDAELYHNLVRAVQKLAQVAGVLELSTPRDALLTTLSKAAVPPQALQIGQNTNFGKTERYFATKSTEQAELVATQSVSASVIESPVSNKASVSILTTRNLLCVRALLHLGIALGPTLSEQAWFILLETLQEAERLIMLSSRLQVNQNRKLADDVSSSKNGTSPLNLTGEIVAVETASKKMFATSSDYENDAFLGLLRALFSLSTSTGCIDDRKDVASSNPNPAPRHVGRIHQSSRSISGTSIKAATEDNEVLFVLTKTSEIAKSNLQRLVTQPANSSGWSLITARLLQVVRSTFTLADIRLRAASLLDTVVLGTLQILDEQDEQLQRVVQERGVLVLNSQVEGLYQQSTSSLSETSSVDLAIHERAIEALSSIVEHHGENLLISWEMIFKLAGTSFEERAPPFDSDIQDDTQATEIRSRSVTLTSTAFRLLQLIGSDFLNLVPLNHLLDFIDILLLFGRQHDDLNVSLTSTTFFWNLADFLHSSPNHPSLSGFSDVPTEEFLLGKVNGSKNPADVIDSLWLVLLLRLNVLTVDPRLEMRKGAIRVMLRILDASGPYLSPRGWYICLTTVVERLLKSHALLLSNMRKEGLQNDPTMCDEWYASTVAVLEGSINLVCHFSSTIIADEHFHLFWEQFFDLLGSILTNPSLAVSLAVFRGVASLFLSLGKADYRNVLTAEAALKLWINHHPANVVDHFQIESVSTKSHDSNEEAFTAHAEALVRISEALPSVQLGQIAAEDIMKALRKTVLQCVHLPYGSDVQKTAPEQESVISILQLLSRTETSKSTEYFKILFDFIKVACEDETELEMDPSFDWPTKQGPTLLNAQSLSLVAFASKCIDILENNVIRAIQEESLLNTSQTVCSAIIALSNTVKSKYTAKGQRGDPLIWRKATVSGLTIVEAVGLRSYKIMDKEELLALKEIYGSAVELANGILAAGGLVNLERPPEDSVILADEEHDIAAFRRLSLSLIPALTRLKELQVAAPQRMPSDIHRRFVISLFHASMVATPQFADLPSDLFSSPLSSFLRIRPGTIKELAYHARSKIPYLALDTMFKLIAALDDDTMQDAASVAGHLEFAKIVAPYVLLRAAHTFKSFVADQPLRGPMPMPSKLRAEMLHVLRLCLELRSEDGAFLGKPGSHTCLGRDGRRHLRVLYPLIVQMWKVWRRVPRYGFPWIADSDGVEIEKCLQRWVEICGEHWELANLES
ncbi:hypothetical protein EPUS_06176 [Endocarpon pusillum Z07020]|uniref:Endosomal peripheral membrane protein n=1 Tax=Endocarpon pusillum (strain Z07020 / HMAS-L-300199) TaxID=1263415 RepID=U1GT26_ENDPU|nr:uncharacterized protein EPUS_06176 [Endocarpon pusillum Z07020]ERF75136.1 hypothetical protein EPUS_06176 [Endocarpon pusillum Z07020]